MYNFMTSELIKNIKDKTKYGKIKEYILQRITEITSLSLEKVIELTENYFYSNYAEILFRINKNSVKLKYLEEIIDKYKEDSFDPEEPEIKKEYEKILKLHIDLLCKLKYYNQILPNLKKRKLYPIKYCLEKCKDLKIYDACIFLEKKRSNFAEALKLFNILLKEHFYAFKSFYQENYDIIKNNKEEDEDSEDEEVFINEITEEEEKINLKKEEEILNKKKY